MEIRNSNVRYSIWARKGDSMGQREQILGYLEENRSITPLDAIGELGIMRLASRISELKKMGYPIAKTMRSGKNRYGKTVSYAEYRLVGKDE